MSELPKVCVISTSFKAPTAHLCKSSVARQLDVEVEHRYIEASEQNPPKGCSENVWAAAKGLPADRICVWLDGDDWLFHRRALARVCQEHAAGMWVTYGTFVTTDGKRGFGAKYDSNDYRKEPWRASHLKSFRAGLLQAMRLEDLHIPPQLACAGAAPGALAGLHWIDRAVDLAIMFAVMEMAGPDRVRFIPDILAVYNFTASFEANADDEEKSREKAIDRFVRAQKPYKRLDNLTPPRKV